MFNVYVELAQYLNWIISNQNPVTERNNCTAITVYEGDMFVASNKTLRGLSCVQITSDTQCYPNLYREFNGRYISFVYVNDNNSDIMYSSNSDHAERKLVHYFKHVLCANPGIIYISKDAACKHCADKMEMKNIEWYSVEGKNVQHSRRFDSDDEWIPG